MNKQVITKLKILKHNIVLDQKKEESLDFIDSLIEILKKRNKPRMDKYKQDLFRKFMEIYKTIPEEVKKEKIIILNEESYSWNVVYAEAKNNTERSYALLIKMEARGFM